MLSAVRLPLRVDASAMGADAAAFDDDEWVPHFNKGYYEGDWSGIALRSVGGVANKLYPDPASTEPQLDTPHLARCPHVRALLERLECEKLSTRFLRLGAGSRIIEHSDPWLGFDDGEIRLHVPVTTGPEVTFLLDHAPVDMHAGEAWYLDLGLPHAVTNTGSAPRVHLVIDCVVNDWLTEVLRRGELVTTIVAFLDEIGIATRFKPIEGDTVLPGIALGNGGLVIDSERLTQPGDLLHEAGHLALLTPGERAAVGRGTRLDSDVEMAAIAWSWAALVHLALDPHVVFHADGYHGGSESIIDNFTAGRYFGVPVLQWRELTADFPRMTAWLRTS